jgi:hypothetical protein
MSFSPSDYLSSVRRLSSKTAIPKRCSIGCWRIGNTSYVQGTKNEREHFAKHEQKDDMDRPGACAERADMSSAAIHRKPAIAIATCARRRQAGHSPSLFRQVSRRSDGQMVGLGHIAPPPLRRAVSAICVEHLFTFGTTMTS